MVETMAAM
jgi:hypothetical protein